MLENKTNVFQPLFDNDTDPFVPEVWALESLMVLYKNVIAVNMVHRDFENEIAQMGDTVNTRRPAKFTAKRKTDTDDVTTQDATATNVAVVLNQHLHVSFVIKDGEESKGMGSLVGTYLEPAMEAIIQGLEEIVIGEKYNFLGTKTGSLGSGATIGNITDLSAAMTDNLCPKMNRNMIITSSTESDLLQLSTFHEADKVGDEGTAMREGSLGRKFGFNFVQSHNNSAVGATTVVSGAINNGAGYAAGTTSITVDGFSAAITSGSWITVAGDMTPQLVTGTTGGGTPTAIAINPGLATAVVNDAVVTVYTPALINNASGYAAGWVKELTIDNAAIAPQVGQMVSNGATTLAAAAKYSAMSTPTTTSVLLNRALDGTLADDAVLGLGPAGNYNWAFHRNAVALVTRPLALPRNNLADAAVQDMDGVSVRVVLTYDGKSQGTRVTVDVLAGVKTLDTNLGAILLG